MRDHIGEFAYAKFSSCSRSKLRLKEVSLKEMLDSISFKPKWRRKRHHFVITSENSPTRNSPRAAAAKLRLKEVTMKLKENTEVVSFLKRVKACKEDVYFVTDEGDRLNLKSTLSQYMCALLVGQKDILGRSRVECSKEDGELLKEYLE